MFVNVGCAVWKIVGVVVVVEEEEEEERRGEELLSLSLSFSLSLSQTLPQKKSTSCTLRYLLKQ
jgi:hypothetical protein